MSHKIVADEWYDPAAQKFDFSGLISKIRDALDKIYDRYGVTGLERAKAWVLRSVHPCDLRPSIILI